MNCRSTQRTSYVSEMWHTWAFFSGASKKKKKDTETLLKIKLLSVVFTQWGES